jgi:hypothetical protein
LIWSNTALTMLLGAAKPGPLPAAVDDRTSVLMPTSRPRASTSGPPLFPGHHGDVGLLVQPDQTGWRHAAAPREQRLAGRRHRDLNPDARRPADDMRIGDDVPVGVDDDARPAGALRRHEVGLAGHHAGRRRQAAGKDLDDAGIHAANQRFNGSVHICQSDGTACVAILALAEGRDRRRQHGAQEEPVENSHVHVAHPAPHYTLEPSALALDPPACSWPLASGL